MPREKPIAFRPTQAQKAFIAQYIEEHPEIKKPSQAVVEIIEEFPKMFAHIQNLESREIPKTKKTSIISFLPSLRKGIAPMIKHEVNRMMRGQDSPFIEAILNMTPRSLNKSMTLATKRGIIILIPSNNP